MTAVRSVFSYTAQLPVLSSWHRTAGQPDCVSIKSIEELDTLHLSHIDTAVQLNTSSIIKPAHGPHHSITLQA